MKAAAGRLDKLRQKYGKRAIDTLKEYRPHDGDEMIASRDSIDQHYTKLWLDYTYGGLFRRKVIDTRTRVLVVIGQCVMLGETEELEEQIPSAIGHGVTPREVLEVILQATVYAGYMKISKALRSFERVMTGLGRMDEIPRTQLPIEGSDPDAKLEDELPKWGVGKSALPKRQELMDKYGWRALSTGLRLQPTHHIRRLEMLNRFDPHFLKLWWDFIYSGMYRRGVLDDKTRTLVMIGNCVAVDEMVNTENHINSALGLGATPREILEVLLQSTAYVGQPRAMKGIDILERILERHGRICELTETATPIPDEDGNRAVRKRRKKS